MLQILLHIVLKILAVLGIGILVLLGLMLLVLTVLLFVPFRYQAEFVKDADTMLLTGKVSWLLHLVRVRVRYEKEAVIQAFILFFKVYDSGKPPKEKKKKQKKKQKEEIKTEVQTEKQAEEQTVTQPEAAASEKDTESTENKEQSQNAEKPETAQQSEASTLSKEEPVKKKKSKNIFYKIREICAKIKEIRSNIRYYVDLLKAEGTKAAFGACKGSIFKVLKSLRPRKLRADLTIGTGAPDTTGYCMAVAGMLYPYFQGHVNIIPDFEKTIFEGHIFCKGRITVFVFLIQALRLYTDKEIRKFIKKFKREEA